MPTFKPVLKYGTVSIDGYSFDLLSKKEFEQFDLRLLGLGDISKPSKSTDAIAAVFDLEGFTTFCKQIEPHLSVPLFLSEFLSWLFGAIKNAMKKADHAKGVALWSPLPFCVKFYGGRPARALGCWRNR
jgi:hypothetical protein